MLAPKIVEIKRSLMDMAGYCIKMLEIDRECMKDMNIKNLYLVHEYEDKINNCQLDIDDRSGAMIALYQPEAKDLRYILSIIRMNSDLERLGDLAYSISESLAYLENNQMIYGITELYDMSMKAISMLKMSIVAFTDEDVEKSKEVLLLDDEVDSLYEELYKRVKKIISNTNVEPSLHILRIAQKYERVADLATNIAEGTIYLVEGKLVQHRSIS